MSDCQYGKGEQRQSLGEEGKRMGTQLREGKVTSNTERKIR